MKLRTLWVLWLVLVAVLATASVRAAERRVALVVGASAYRAVPALRNTLNDAREIAAALGRLQFEVDLALDPDRFAFETAVRQFGERARTADVALFFYAGHAVEANGRNWLLPISADVRGGRDLRFEAIELDGVLEQIEGGARLSVIVLDSCRDNPFRMRLGEGGRGLDRGGLAQVQAAAGTLVVFSTAPGTVAADGAGPNSPFTTALLKRIETPGTEIRQVLADVRRDVREATKGQQVPWEQSAMEGALYLKPMPETRAAGPTATRPDADTMFWDAIRNSAKPAELRAYLDRFPNGIFADLARSRLASPAAGTPDQLAARLIAARPIPSVARWSDAARRYAEARLHKAFAVLPERDAMWWTAEWGSAARAEVLALERCQLAFGSPCRLVALDQEVLAATQPRDMPRLRYDGPFRVNEIPAVADSLRDSAALSDYPTASAPKAMALHPSGGAAAAVTSGASQRGAEELALARCNADPGRRGPPTPCFLYAAGNQVVLAQRRTQPIAPALPARARSITDDAPP